MGNGKAEMGRKKRICLIRAAFNSLPPVVFKANSRSWGGVFLNLEVVNVVNR